MQLRMPGGLLQTGLKTVSQRRMRPGRAVQGLLQIGKYIGLRAGLDGILFEMDQLALETAEEIFYHSVVVGIVLSDILCRIP